jgi:DNA-binding GntR family transcriptional regulator
VYEAVRSELLNAVLAPGEKLKLVELSSRFGVSQSVMREALTRLTEQGLVVSTPQRGFRVLELSIDDMEDLSHLRVEMESSAFRMAMTKGDVGWETAVVAAHHGLERTPVEQSSGYNEEWSVRHRDYHVALLAGCGSPRLMSLTASLRDNAELYRRWYWAFVDDHKRDLAGEHRQLMELSLARKVDEAIELLDRHISGAPRALARYIAEHGVESLGQPLGGRRSATK